jgi:hypothetical protein
MIASLAIATGLIAILDDDNAEIDFDELFKRAVMFNNPQVLLSALSPEQRSELYPKLVAWMREAVDLEDYKSRLNQAMFFVRRGTSGDRLEWEDTKVLLAQEMSFGGKRIFQIWRRWIQGAEDYEITKRRKFVADPNVDVIEMDWFDEQHGLREIIAWDENKILAGSFDIEDHEYEPFWITIVNRPDGKTVEKTREDILDTMDHELSLIQPGRTRR